MFRDRSLAEMVPRGRGAENWPLVSVLMTTFKHEPYLAQAIEGVLDQRCDFPFELVIGDDCSPDRTREIAEYYARQFPEIVRVVGGGVNIGLAKNQKRAFDACGGKYIAFCEGDDWWCDHGKLQKQVEKFSNDAVGMVHCDYSVARPTPEGGWSMSGGNLATRNEKELRGCAMFPIFMKELIPRLSASVYRRELLEQYYGSRLGNLDYVTTDLPMVIFAAAESCVDYVPVVGAVYRNSPNSITRSGFRKTIAFLEGVDRIFVDIGEIYGGRGDYDAQACAWVPTMQARAAFRLNDARAFKLAMSRLQQIDPKAARALPIVLRKAALDIGPLARIVNMVLDSR